MALSITNAGSAASISSGATLAIGSITASVGDMLVLAVAADNNGTNGAASLSTTVTDSAGNTWVNRGGIINFDPGAAAAGVSMSIWTCDVAIALAGGTVTANFSPNTTAKAGIIKRVQPGVGETVGFRAVGAGSTGAGSGVNIASVDNGDTVFVYTGQEANVVLTDDADTVNGSWSTGQSANADTGTSATSITIQGQHKTVNATGGQTVTYGGTTDRAHNWITLYPAVPPSLAIIPVIQHHRAMQRAA